jgi:hypothetical protein
MINQLKYGMEVVPTTRWKETLTNLPTNQQKTNQKAS